ncbi:endonuclease/exonuclease/phosphatase family protein [Quadrisphaera sp. INWT6]|uniref:endonuclease/exonuclease/phosphatase family protein n=1 Tax=Quadrisphaera sp. INWT6 TaxID=2596917 RepID=UPI0018924B94|nr:endonuclease/exonuclease/phosphatase family protein [Quadrisphaera sp. INWT6]MBF5080312.1 endonuclease/exonuclease/phosphatase family protein [Quadrisphaera sp. INWT6]
MVAVRVLAALVAAGAVVLFAAPHVGVERWQVIAPALPARGALAVAASAALVVVLLLLVTRVVRLRLGLPLAAALALAVGLHLPVVLARGVVGEPVAAPAAGQLRVLEWNTNGRLTTPDVVAELAVAQHADLVVLPQQALRTDDDYRAAFTAAGQRMVRVNDELPSEQVAVWASPGLAGRYTALPGPDPRKAVELVPDNASLPTVLALHAPWPVGPGLPGWERDVDWVAARCSTTSPVLVAGDFNASVDDFGGPRLGLCADAASLRHSAGVGTWRTGLPPLLAMPIDHVLATPAVGRVTSFTVLSSEDGSGTRHRPTMTVFTPTG